MFGLTKKRCLVEGLDRPSLEAARLLLKAGAAVSLTSRRGDENSAADHAGLGNIERLGFEAAMERDFDLVVHGPKSRPSDFQPFLDKKVPVVSDLELAFRQSLCLLLAVGGTNGRKTTVDLIDQVLNQNRRLVVGGMEGRPVCQAAAQSKEADFLLARTETGQLEGCKFFRPVVAVLHAIYQDDVDRYPMLSGQARVWAKLFENQQPFDWAIVQSEALAQVRALSLPVSGKVITFSAHNRRADIYLERGLIISRLPDWPGPLIDMDHCRLRGPQNAESIMAALLVGRVLRVPLETMTRVLKEAAAGPDRYESLGDINGVQCVNDANSRNTAALSHALEATPWRRKGDPNIWLIAGGADSGLEYHDVGPLLAERVKHAFLLGPNREKLRASWSLFTPCALVDSLEEAVEKSFEKAVRGDVILYSPSSRIWGGQESIRARGEEFQRIIESAKKDNM